MEVRAVGAASGAESLMAVAEIAGLLAEAERGRRGKAGMNASSTRAEPKRLGEMAEAEFLARVERLKFGVACPWGDSERYDFIVDRGGRLWKVQVKSAHRAGQDGCYSFRMYGSSLAAYRENEVDVLVAYVVPSDVWYVFPVKELKGLRSLKIFSGSRRKRSKYEKFREAWWVFESQKSKGKLKK